MIAAILFIVLPFIMAFVMRNRYQFDFWHMVASLSIFSFLMVLVYAIWYHGTLTVASPEIPAGDPRVANEVLKSCLMYLLGSFLYTGLLAKLFQTRHHQADR